ncbi:hypothetical protein MPSEU_001074500 [Mayamaea pseudoterrestris]|nr:hypothetical protein MPSEU_001074500 [Mayamaea pseudoterrestris]
MSSSHSHQTSDDYSSSNIPKNMSTMSLERRLQQLKEESQKLDQTLTQKLASSPSGQNLLHMSTSLNTLPPDLHLLLQQLHPIYSQAEQAESSQWEILDDLTQAARAIQLADRRVIHANDCIDLYEDLMAAEACVIRRNKYKVNDKENENRKIQEEEHDWDANDDLQDDLNYASSLERASHVTLCLIHDLHIATDAVSALTTSGKRGLLPSTSSNDTINDSMTTTNKQVPSLATPLPDDCERAQFVMKLAPRIRRLEAETIKCLAEQFEFLLKEFHALQTLEQQKNANNDVEEPVMVNDSSNLHDMQQQSLLLVMLGHVMRGLALLGRGKEVESIFGRVAIMPLVRPQITMGRMDEGGNRGECAGLERLLQDVLQSVIVTYGPVVRMSETMFVSYDGPTGNDEELSAMLDVDLLTAGVWVPLATALMADSGIQMAIFSPGIASILQANYTTLDRFLAQLADRVLLEEENAKITVVKDESKRQTFDPLQQNLTEGWCRKAQERIYAHPKTAEFTKRWNLPIYYQLRFGECCTRLNKAIDATRRNGWIAQVFSGSEDKEAVIKSQSGLEISFFVELYDVIFGLWRPDVILTPLANRFLRGAIQVIGRTVTFVEEGMRCRVRFGDEPKPREARNGATENGNGQALVVEATDASDGGAVSHAPYPSRAPYYWGESEVDVAGVAWELNILESILSHEYGTVVCEALKLSNFGPERAEIREIVDEMLKEASNLIHPLIDMAWNEIIVELITKKCAQPLAAVKGVAATYRMTNRPPPTQASPFVGTVLRPLKEFIDEFGHRIPDRVGSKWKHQIVATIAEQYALAVEELISTVQRTEVALNSRRTRKSATGGMRDGEKVKLQVFLDYEQFTKSLEDVGVDPATVIGVSKLKQLTAEGEELLKRNENGSGNI